MTDRSPRTPPALSNATPRQITVQVSRVLAMRDALVHNDTDEAYNQLFQMANDEQPNSDPYKPWKHLELPAAPPVAEGPAATPRPITIQNETLYRDPDNPDCLLSEMQWKQRIAGPSGVSQPQAVSSWGVSENLTVLPKPAAAEPPEARAAARQQCDEFLESLLNSQEDDGELEFLQCYLEHSTNRNWLAGQIAQQMAAYAADLQRQLDEALRELDAGNTALKAACHAMAVNEMEGEDYTAEEAQERAEHNEAYFRRDSNWQPAINKTERQLAVERAESAEAANQELRRALVKCADKFREYEQLHLAKGAEQKAAANRQMAEMAEAVLGPQHGDTT